MSRLRVGLLIGSKGLLAWHEQIITTLTDHDGIEFVGFSRLPDEADGHASSRHWLDRLETLFSHRLFKTKRADAPLVTKQLDSAPAVVVIDDLDADLVVSLDGDAHTRLPTNAGAREIWHLTFDGIDRSDGRVAASGWYEGTHVIEVALWRRGGESDDPTPIECAYFGTFMPSWSVNRSRVLWRAAVLIGDNIVRLAEGGHTSANRIRTDETPAARHRTAPSSFRLGLLFARRLVDHIRQKLFYVEQWQVLATRSAADMLNPKSYARLEPPPDRFWADPFAVRRRDKDYIFVEELVFKENKGKIAVLEHRDGELLNATTIIAEPYHMSYPYIVDHEGDLYMVPETREKRSIDIWKSASFPDKWTHAGTLMDDVSAGDSTLFRHEGRWWMFTNLSRTKYLRSADELHAFYSDDPTPVTRNWVPHRMNPLVRDTRTARQGGRVFVDDQGRLIRSAQDTAVRYGYAVLLFHVERLTPTDYAETLLHKVEPDWHDDVVGMHTFERRGDLCVLDACFIKPRLRVPL